MQENLTTAVADGVDEKKHISKKRLTKPKHKGAKAHRGKKQRAYHYTVSRFAMSACFATPVDADPHRMYMVYH